MGREEQVEEREVLESIFPDEITDIDEDQYRIAIKLDLPDDAHHAGDDDEDDDTPVLLLTVRYPEEYPDKEPHLDLSAPQNGAPQHPYFNIAEDKEELLAGLQETIQENLGMAMVFTLVSAVKDAAEQLIATRKEAADNAEEERKREAERVENEKFHGTTVNRETFLKWRDSFNKEMAEKRKKEDDDRLADLKKVKGSVGTGIGVGKDGVRLTGKQLFESGLVGKGDDEEAGAEGDDDDDSNDNIVPVKGVEKLKVEA